MEIYKYILVASAGYLLGSLSMSIILSRAVLGEDVRRKGSGNAGATNMARVYGLKAGALTLGGDVLKASLSMLIGWLLLGDVGLALGGIASLVGHCFPVYYNFRGGKGVSVGAAVALAIDWRVFLSIVLVFALAAFLSKKVSLGSVCAAVAISITSLIFQVSTPKLILAVFGMLLVVFQHRENIKRLINGTEPDFKPAKPPVKDNIET
ncbi:MAG: acyl-phosphate glycerol 3-phosphate acyltransferase [Clostridia bacterium]|nr:glycerol-3-phosphate 1-O-acyltransferase PlsY [Oscillospiraceae bacterium]MBS5433905.1 glycerol-3-phosphate 1-O-acyltransferase PlsY [Bacillota bacterium]PWM14952.1 MAG: acyl-phosphate glycerol 3-phosphate acyltransferase [Clostridia bacterium]